MSAAQCRKCFLCWHLREVSLLLCISLFRPVLLSWHTGGTQDRPWLAHFRGRPWDQLRFRAPWTTGGLGGTSSDAHKTAPSYHDGCWYIPSLR